MLVIIDTSINFVLNTDWLFERLKGWNSVADPCTPFFCVQLRPSQFETKLSKFSLLRAFSTLTTKLFISDKFSVVANILQVRMVCRDLKDFWPKRTNLQTHRRQILSRAKNLAKSTNYTKPW